MEMAAPEAAVNRAGCSRWALDMAAGPWPSALEKPVGKQLGLGRCQCIGTAWRHTIQKSCLGIFRLLFSLDSRLAWKRAAAGRPGAPCPLLDGRQDLEQELLLHKFK